MQKERKAPHRELLWRETQAAQAGTEGGSCGSDTDTITTRQHQEVTIWRWSQASTWTTAR